MCSDCEAYGLKKHGLARSDCTYLVICMSGADQGGGVMGNPPLQML